MDTQEPQNITILGAGIMGLMSAYTLAQFGHAITLIDPNGLPNPSSASPNASQVAGGMLAPYSEIEHMDLTWVDAALKSIEIWKDTSLDTGFTQNGSLLIACPEDQHILQRFQNHIPAHIQSHPTPQDIEPALDTKFKTALYLKPEAHLNPTKTLHALCENLKTQPNVTLSTKHPIIQSSNHPITINCIGMAANDLQNSNELRGVKGETLIVRNPDFTLSRPIRLMHPRYPLYIIPREDKIFMIGATNIESAQNDTVSLRSAMELMSALHTLSPTFANAEIIDIKSGIRPAYPDNLPRIIIKNNTISANGLFRHGYLLAPIMAHCIADHINGKTNPYMHLFTKEDKDENHNQRAA